MSSEVSPSIPDHIPPDRLFRWWHAALLLCATNLIGAIPVGFAGDEEFYNSLARPSVAPPSWLFSPMWLFLNATSLVALWTVANRASQSRARIIFLWSEAVGWVLFAIFSSLYFGLRSPILGAVDTLAFAAITLVSLVCATRLSRSACWMLLPRMLWLLLAIYVSTYSALNSPDAIFGA